MNSQSKVDRTLENHQATLQPVANQTAPLNPFDLSQLVRLSRLPILNRFLCSSLSALTGLSTLEDHYSHLKPFGLKGKDYINHLIQYLGFKIQVTAPHSNQVVPHDGSTLIMSNHPYGITDGLVLLHYALKHRSDVKILINKAITQIDEFDELAIPVNPYGGRQAQIENILAMRECQRWLNDGHCLIVFPAGEVSHYQPTKNSVCDGKWSAHIARLLKKSNATVVPVFFHGHNNWLFQLSGLISPWLRTLMLGRCFINSWEKAVHFSVGEQILPKTYRKTSDINELAKFLRLQSYLLQSKPYSSQQALAEPAPDNVENNSQPLTNKVAIIPPINADLLSAEVAALPEKNRLLSTGEMAIYFASKQKIPHLMQEIGRLREETFRHVGEGTGKAIDIDDYDEYYTHLFIWKASSKEVVGAYRAAEVSKVVEQFGVSGLYSHSLFKFKPSLLKQLAPAVELGRSFVRIEYQRSYAPLLMLWKGVATFLAKETDCSVLFGPVSISKDYSNKSQKLLIDFLRVNNPYPQQSKAIKARNPFKLQQRVTWSKAEFEGLRDIELISNLVSKLESDQKGVPILLKQYLKLGGYVLSFNVDQDFSDVLDCMIVVDVPQNDQKTLQRYMGAELASDFLQRHQPEQNSLAS